jgi:hypothetical protein
LLRVRTISIWSYFDNLFLLNTDIILYLFYEAYDDGETNGNLFYDTSEDLIKALLDEIYIYVVDRHVGWLSLFYLIFGLGSKLEDFGFSYLFD